MVGFPADWVEYPDGSMGPPGSRMPRPAGNNPPRANRGRVKRSYDGTEDDPEVLGRRRVETFEEEFRSRPTVYRGIQFRSRIEARWAVIFDFFGIQWEFEPEHYSLPVGNYLPDFWLVGQDCWIEIKGPHPTEFEQAKARGLARLTQKVVYIFCCGIPRIGQDGAPWDYQCGKDLWAHGYRYNPDGTEAMGYMFAVKECCGTLGIVQDAQTPKIQCDCDASVAEWDDNYLRSLQVAMMRGRKARWD
jgi:hypothetical protein